MKTLFAKIKNALFPSPAAIVCRELAREKTIVVGITPQFQSSGDIVLVAEIDDKWYVDMCTTEELEENTKTGKPLTALIPTEGLVGLDTYQDAVGTTLFKCLTKNASVWARVFVARDV